MKFVATSIVFSLCCVLFASAAETDFKAKKEAISEECKKKLSFGDDDAAIFFSKEVPKNENQSCFLECAYEKLGLIQGEEINSEGSKKLAQQKYGNDAEKLKKAQDLLDTCIAKGKASQSKEKCWLGKNLRTCFVENENQLNVFTSETVKN